MNDMTIHGGDAVTMTSLELVDYINSQRSEGETELLHKNFLAKVPQVLGEETSAKFSADLPDGYGRPRKGYHFPKREACLMAMSYSYELQAKVFDKMTELEARPAQPLIPQTLPEALRLAADLADQRNIAQAALAIAAPKAEALDRMTLADGEGCLQAAGKLLQQPPNKFIVWLRSLGTWIFKRQGSSRNSAYTDKINAGYLNVRTSTMLMPDGSERVNEQVVVTPKGLVKLAQMLGVEITDDIGGMA